MTWFGWLLVAYWAATGLLTVALVGRKRTPVTPIEAVIVLVIYGLLVWGVLAIGTGTS